MKKRYLVVQIGCIECGVSSYPIAFVDTMEEAEKIKDEHPDTWDTEGGEGYVVIWDLNEDYLSNDIMKS